MVPSSPNYFLGRIYDPKTNENCEKRDLCSIQLTCDSCNCNRYDGFRKNRIMYWILEEAALHSIPAIIIDPKGDLTNLLLHFPTAVTRGF